MTTYDTEATINNAEAIIERFGGIRPMASKISVPVTTVQGWKKRNVIPAARLEQIKAAAQLHNVDIADILILSAGANENRAHKTERPAVAASANTQIPPHNQIEKVSQTEKESRDSVLAGSGEHRPRAMPGTIPPIVYENMAERVSRAEQRAIAKSTAINVVFLLVTAAAVVLLLWPEARKSTDGGRIQSLEQNLTQLQNEIEAVQKTIPADVSPRVATTAETTAPVSAPVTTTYSPSYSPSYSDPQPPQPTAPQPYLFGPQAAPANVTAAGAAPMPDMAARFKEFQATPEGQDQLVQGWEAISNYMGAYNGEVQQNSQAGISSDPASMQAMLENGLEILRAQNPALAKIFEGIPMGNLRQAASVLGFSQLSSVLDMNGAPFEMDLRVVRSLIGNDYPELAQALDGMASYAVSGVLTPVALTSEFAGLSGEIVSASLKGENVPITEKVMAHLNNYVQVEKAGNLISGTQTQAAIGQMQSALQNGDLSSAINAAQSLGGPAASIVAPWLNQAQVTMKAQQLKTMLNRAMSGQGGSPGYTTMDAPLLGGGMQNPYSQP